MLGVHSKLSLLFTALISVPMSDHVVLNALMFELIYYSSVVAVGSNPIGPREPECESGVHA